MSNPWPPTPPPEKRSRGRPRDLRLTHRLKDGALLLVAERGFGGLNAEVLAAHAGAGKSGVYRRWDTMADLVADALSDHQLVPHPTHTASLLVDLCGLLKVFHSPLTVAERAAAAIIGPARSDSALAAALHASVVDPLRTALVSVMTAHSAGTPDTDARRRLMQTVVMALWWERYITAGPVLNRDQLEQLVGRCLLPVMRTDHG